MLTVITHAQAQELLSAHFQNLTGEERVSLKSCVSRVLSQNVISGDYVPDFSRSTVDGYAVRAEDTFGCSESIPALLKLKGEVLMGKAADIKISAGECAYVPTGGALPEGANAMVMLEYTEDFGGTMGILKASAPGAHIIFRGDDVSPGITVFRQGHRLFSKDVGALAAMGLTDVPVFKKVRVAILSTGDEIVSPDTKELNMGQMRDVNSPMLAAAVAEMGGEAIELGIIPDDPDALKAGLDKAIQSADLVLLSGGSSVGVKDQSAVILNQMGELLFHGLALKPGKPTMAAKVQGKPVFGLPGHPAAAYFIFHLLVRPLLCDMMGRRSKNPEVEAFCAVAIPSNNGREECVLVSLEGEKALPIMSKSGLITALSGADGFIRIPRDAEGVSGGEKVKVYLFSEEL